MPAYAANGMAHDPPTLPMPAAQHPDSCSTIDLAHRVGVSRQTVQRWVDAGLIASWRTPGGHRRLDMASVERFLQGLGTAPAATHGLLAAGDGRPEKFRVLVVDDVPLQREVTQMVVHHAVPDADVQVADDGLEALIAIGRFNPHLVVTDIVMPHMDGVQMIRLLSRADMPRPAVIAVTGHTAAEVAARGPLPAGVPMLFKPYDPLQLAELVNAAAAKVLKGHAAPATRGRRRVTGGRADR